MATAAPELKRLRLDAATYRPALLATLAPPPAPAPKRSADPPTDPPTDPSHLAAVLAECERLRSELSKLEQSRTDPPHPPSEAAVLQALLIQLNSGSALERLVAMPEPAVRALLERALRRQCLHLAEAAFQTEARVAAAQLENKRLQTVLAQHQEIAAALARRAAPPEPAQVEYRRNEIRQENKTLWSELSLFIDEYYPPVRPQRKRKRGDAEEEVPNSEDDGEQSQSPMFSLKPLLQALLNQALRADPYIVLDPQLHWDLHVELLVRCAIAVRHPRDATRLRLADF
eukprot:TRINITY_DN7643_c0_g1_i1.p1 TRINITY_DN7643_c0_g1~~TRINITY_DN7643_c0_g1_i1.p1  ORF type:complete len:287 (-),score=71.51 TRINITY_DN7643_c0_g1_i1:55-915(-)